MTGYVQEHLEFTIWFLVQKGLIGRADNSHIVITAPGVEYLEEHYQTRARSRLLEAARHTG